MQLKILGSNSAGNCYLLKSSSGEVLMIECGVHIDKIKQALGFNLKNVSCICTHGHNDHCKSVSKVMAAGIDVYASAGTIEEMGISGYRLITIVSRKEFSVGSFTILPFDVRHDAKEPLGFLIYHEECGNTLFLTDSYYSPYQFDGLNNLIIEANFCEDLIDEKVSSSGRFVRNRVIGSHLSIQNCIDLLRRNDLSQANNICLIHLSDSNSDSARFKKEVESITGKSVHVAEAGMTIPFDKQPY